MDMTRPALALIAVAAAAACAPMTTSGAHAPRPFPTARVAEAAARVPARPDTPAPAAGAAAVSGPAVSADRASLSSAVLATALDLRGTPYRLGGTDLSGFDCSGFVQYVLRRHAIDMPRTVIEQFSVGAVPGDIEPGDLLFFQTIGSKASHVGIAIDDTSFVHAPNSRGVVRVDRFDAPYWAGRFVGARRVF